MPRRRACRPCVVELEGRVVLSHVLPHRPAAPRHAAPAQGMISVQPLATNGHFPGADWFRVHQLYAAEAAYDRAPIVFLGDSITTLWGQRTIWDEPAGTYPGSRAWAAHFAPLGATTFGVPGDRTENLLWRLDHRELAGRPRLVVMMVGLNNLLTGESADETAHGVSAVVRSIRLHSPRSRVLLLGLLPVPAYDQPGEALPVQIAEVNDRIRRLDRIPGVTYLDPSPAFLDEQGAIRTDDYANDLMHPGPAGYAALARAIEPAVLRLSRPAGRRR